MPLTDNISKPEIIRSLQPINHRFFHIDDLDLYAQKILNSGKAEVIRDRAGKLLSYILYYDNQADIFISMVWTHPQHQGKGLAKKTLQNLIEKTGKNIVLEVHQDNPAKYLYEKAGFKPIKQANDLLTMKLERV